MAIRHTNQPTASPRGAAIRRGVGSILLLLAGCADLDDLEARADVDDARPGTILAAYWPVFTLFGAKPGGWSGRDGA